MQIRAAIAGDIPAAAAMAAGAFALDPTTEAFFAASNLGRAEATRQFFSLLLEARIALGMPVLVAGQEAIVGLAMGYDTTQPDWPAEIQSRWDRLEALHPGLDGLFDEYERIVETCKPDMPVYVLGALAVDARHRGTGLGKALTRAFLDRSDRDPASEGTVLETASPANLGFYRGLGFEVRGSGPLGPATLWSMFRPKPVDS